MTWKEFKDAVESRGYAEDVTIESINVCFPQEPIGVYYDPQLSVLRIEAVRRCVVESNTKQRKS